MKIKDYLIALNSIVESNPEALEYDVIYSSDSEGNWFDDVHFKPTRVMMVDNERVFDSESAYDDYHEDYDDLDKPKFEFNAIIIN